MGGSRGGGAGGPDPLESHKNIGFLCNTGPDPLKKHKSTKPAFNFGPSSARQRNAIPSTKKTLSKLDPLWQIFLDPRMQSAIFFDVCAFRICRPRVCYAAPAFLHRINVSGVHFSSLLLRNRTEQLFVLKHMGNLK